MASPPLMLDSLSASALQRLYAANSAASTTRIRLAGGARKVPVPGSSTAYAWASDNDLHNGVSQMVLQPSDDPIQIVRAIAKEGLLLTGSERGKAAGTCHWVVGPVPHPELEQALRDEGFVLDDDEPAMAAQLDEDENELLAKHAQAVARVGGGFEITPVEHDAAGTLDDWMTAWGGGMTPLDVLEGWKGAYEVLLRDLPQSEFSMFVGRIGGQAVGTGIMYCAEGIAAVHYISSLPEFRRRGIGKALTLHSMMLARRTGCRIAMLTASDVGVGVYRSLGFKEFGQQRTYLYTMPSQRS